jgi:uncharacterized membrane protein
MKWSRNPSFRKDVIPWHHSNLFCLVISIFSGVVFYFSIEGIGVALEHEAYRRHAWVPVLLTLLSGVLLTVNLFRILSRMIYRSAEDE